jgi:hypothetical protein
MATATFKLFGLSVPELIGRVREIITRLTANAAVYATPNPPAATLTSQVDALDDSYQQALSGDRARKLQMRLDRKTLLQSMSLLQAYIQMTSAGDPSLINLVADVKKSGSPAGIKPPPARIRSYFGYVNGEIRFLYGGVKGRIFYRVQMNPTPGNNSGWTDYAQTTKNRVLLQNLVSGQEYAIRAATVTSEGMGEWSDPVIQRAL